MSLLKCRHCGEGLLLHGPKQECPPVSLTTTYAPALPSETRWRHRKRGSVYTQVGVASVQSTVPIGEPDDLLIYRGEDGRLWARPLREFLERFDPVEGT